MKYFIPAVVVCAAIPSLKVMAGEPATKVDGAKGPHIILIMTDQQRFDALGCAGNSSIFTPNIDKLAMDGNLYSNAYSSAPSSTPARAGLLTGMSPWHHGMLGYSNVAEHYECEMPQMLRDLGYMTLGIGKMHWKPQNALHGFHATILDESGRVESPYFMSDYRKWFAMEAFGANPDLTGIGWNDHGAGEYKLAEELHPTTWTGDMAVSTIDNYSSDQPLFLKISFARPHSPYDPPQRYLDMYEGVAIPSAAQGEWSKGFGAGVDPLEDKDAAFGAFSDEYVKNSRKHYYAAITFIDDHVGRIIESLKGRGMYDNSLIVFVSDHGDMMGDHNHWRKTYAYEGSAAIPYIVKLPASSENVVGRGEEILQPVELRDLLPTFLDINGAEQPEVMDGLSLLELTSNKRPEWREYIDMEHATCYSEDNYWCALTDGKIKYIWFFNNQAEQLFDLERDPLESYDLSNDKKYADTLEKMRAHMVEHLAERGQEWVKDGVLQQREKAMLHSPNYPTIKK